MAWAAKSRKVVTGYQFVQWTGTNLSLIETVLGTDVIQYSVDASDNPILLVNNTFIPVNDNIVATLQTSYSTGPPVVLFVPGTFVEVVTNAQLAARYQDP